MIKSAPIFQRRLNELYTKKARAIEMGNEALNGNVLSSVGQNLKAMGGTIADYTGLMQNS